MGRSAENGDSEGCEVTEHLKFYILLVGRLVVGFKVGFDFALFK